MTIRIKLSFAAISFLIFFISCSGLSPFFSGNRTRALMFCSQDGDMVAYVNLTRNKELLAKIIGAKPSDLSRFRDIVAVLDNEGIYGILEGDIPKIARNIVAKKLGGKYEKKDGIGYYKAKTEEGKYIKFDLIYPGVVLFSFGDYTKAYRTFVSERENKFSQPVSDFMQSHELAIYAVEPYSEYIPMFKKSAMKGTLLSIDYDKKNNRVILNGVMQFNNKANFNSMRVSIQNDFVKYIKKDGGSKFEMLNLMKTTKYSEIDYAIMCENCSLPIDMLKSMFTSQGQ